MGALLLVAVMAGVAFANGANDVSRGISTVVGAGLAGERRAILWGTIWTLLGVGIALLVSRGLVETFSGKGLLIAPPTSLAWPAAVGAGVIGWLLLATRMGLPVSTTHVLVGAIVGSGIAAVGPAGVNWMLVAGSVAVPLLLSPVVSVALVRGLLPAASGAFSRLGGYCVCLEQRELMLAPAGRGPGLSAGRELHVLTGTDCPPRVLSRVNALDSMHWLSAGLTSFARGLNDAPKILALGLLAGGVLGVGAPALMVLVGVSMGAGGWFAGRRVTGTLASRITPMTGAEGLTANAVTSVLVGLASSFGWPVSTTHVSAGAVIGIGAQRREAQWHMVRSILLAWLVTVPAAAALAAATYLLAVR